MIAYIVRYESKTQSGYIGALNNIYENICKANFFADKDTVDWFYSSISYMKPYVKIVQVNIAEVEEKKKQGQAQTKRELGFMYRQKRKTDHA